MMLMLLICHLLRLRCFGVSMRLWAPHGLDRDSGSCSVKYSASRAFSVQATRKCKTLSIFKYVSQSFPSSDAEDAEGGAAVPMLWKMFQKIISCFRAGQDPAAPDWSAHGVFFFLS